MFISVKSLQTQQAIHRFWPDGWCIIVLFTFVLKRPECVIVFSMGCGICVRYCFCTALGRQINKHEFSLMTKYVSHCFVRCDGKNKAMQTQAAAAFHLNEQQPAVSSLLNPVKCNGQSLAPGLDLYWMHTLCFFFLILSCWQHLYFRIMI